MSRLPDVLEKVVSLSRADACIVIVTATSSTNLRWANNTSTTNGVGDDEQISIISIIDERVGSVTRSYFPTDRLGSLVKESEAACMGRPRAQDVAPLVEGAGYPSDWSAEQSPTNMNVLEGFARDLGHAFKQAESADLSLFGYAEHRVSTVYMATSGGVRRRFQQRRGKAEITAKSLDYSRSAWIGRATKSFDDVDLAAIYSTLEERIGRSRREIGLPPERYEVILEPSAVADMLIYMYGSMSARDADEGRSVFSRPGGGSRIGEKVFADGVSLYSDPLEPALETAPFVVTHASDKASSIFDNGLTISPQRWAEDGVLQRLITTRHWGAESGTKPAPEVGNLIVPSAGPHVEEMVAGTERGLLVTCLWYIRMVDPQNLLLTGLTRDGVFLIADGKIRGAANNFRFNMSPVDMLRQTIEIGESEDALGREFNYLALTRVPPIRVESWNMSSVSEAK